MVPLLCIAAQSGTGKTTLLKKVIPLLREKGIRPGLIKHTHHHMDVDTPGKDSFELRKAGAAQTLVVSQKRWALMTETPDEATPDLGYLAGRMDTSALDLVLIEGFKHEAVPRILLCRKGFSPYAEASDIDHHVIAIASDTEIETDLPLLDINSPRQIADFIAEWLKTQTRAAY